MGDLVWLKVMVSWQTGGQSISMLNLHLFFLPNSCHLGAWCLSPVKDDFGIVKGNQALGCGQEPDVSKEAASIKSEQLREKKNKGPEFKTSMRCGKRRERGLGQSHMVNVAAAPGSGVE